MTVQVRDTVVQLWPELAKTEYVVTSAPPFDGGGCQLTTAAESVLAPVTTLVGASGTEIAM